MTSLNPRLRRIGDRLVGPGQPVYVIGEIGINHNGEVSTALALIDQAKAAGMDAVKFQKRTPEVCTPLDQWDVERDTPWGRMTYLAYRHRVEFGEQEYRRIDDHCRRIGITWFASPWDVESVDFLAAFDDADTLFLTEIYPAGEDPIEGVSGAALAHAMNARGQAKKTRSAWTSPHRSAS